MFCSNCGFQLKDDANFCLKCGNKNIENSSINTKKNTTFPPNTTSKEINTKKPKIGGFIIIGAVLLLLSIGFVSYYISLSKFSSSNTKNSDKPSTKDTVTPNKNITNKDSNTKSDTDTTKINSPDYYIFPKSISEKLLDSDVSVLAKENLPLAKNEIYARHGFAFKTEPFKSYFNKKSWYKPNANFKGSDKEFSDVESYNIQLILKYENK